MLAMQQCTFWFIFWASLHCCCAQQENSQTRSSNNYFIDPPPSVSRPKSIDNKVYEVGQELSLEWATNGTSVYVSLSSLLFDTLIYDDDSICENRTDRICKWTVKIPPVITGEQLKVPNGSVFSLKARVYDKDDDYVAYFTTHDFNITKPTSREHSKKVALAGGLGGGISALLIAAVATAIIIWIRKRRKAIQKAELQTYRENDANQSPHNAPRAAEDATATHPATQIGTRQSAPSIAPSARARPYTLDTTTPADRVSLHSSAPELSVPSVGSHVPGEARQASRFAELADKEVQLI